MPGQSAIALIDCRADENRRNRIGPERVLELKYVITDRSFDAVVFELNVLVVEVNFLRPVVLAYKLDHVLTVIILLIRLRHEPLVHSVFLLNHSNRSLTFKLDHAHISRCLVK